MTTFSRLVDDIVVETVRPDMKAVIATYTNQTIRDMHFRPNTQAPVLYDANRYEELLAITSEGTWPWNIPSGTRFQDVEAIFLDQPGIYLERKNPRIALNASFEPFARNYWYRSGPVITMHGVGIGWTGKISYFMYPRTLGYKVPADRKAVYDPDSDSYQAPDGSPATEADLELETHWLLTRWADVIKEGVRAKLYKRLGEIDRTKLSFSAFESARTAVWNTEPSS